jgi:hypothetical protein
MKRNEKNRRNKIPHPGKIRNRPPVCGIVRNPGNAFEVFIERQNGIQQGGQFNVGNQIKIDPEGETGPALFGSGGPGIDPAEDCRRISFGSFVLPDIPRIHPRFNIEYHNWTKETER